MLKFAFQKAATIAMGRYGVVTLISLMLFQAWPALHSSQPNLDPVQARAADVMVERIVDAIGAYAGDNWNGRYVKVARLRGDPGDEIRRQLEKKLPGRTKCRLVTDSVFAELRDRIAGGTARLGVVSPVTADAWKNPPVVTAEEAADLARRLKLNFVLFGTVDDFRLINGEMNAKIVMNVMSAEAKSVVFARTFDNQKNAEGGSVPAPSLGMAAPPVSFPRLVIALIFALVLPLCTGSVWLRLLERQSVGVNVLCVLILTAVDALAAWPLLGFGLSSLGHALFFVICVILTLNYNIFILNLFERNRKARKFAF